MPNPAVDQINSRLRGTRAANLCNALIAAGYTINASVESALPDTCKPCIRITGHTATGHKFTLYIE